MVERVARHWWILLLRGIVAIVLGILAIALPGVTAFALSLLFGAYALVDGVLAIVAAVRMAQAEGRWVWLLAEGVFGVLFGIVAFVYPGISLLVLVALLATWALISGVLAITTAWELRKVIAGEWFWILSGLLSIALGIWVLFDIRAGVLAVAYLFGFYAILTGFTFAGLAIRLRSAGSATATGG